MTAPLLEAEWALRPDERAGYPARLDAIRARGLSRVEGDFLRGVASVAAPVFGHAGAIVAVIAALGPQGTFDVASDGRHAVAVKAAAARLSARLGFRGAL